MAGFAAASSGSVIAGTAVTGTLAFIGSFTTPERLARGRGIVACRIDPGSGAWTAPLGPVSEPAFYSLAEEASGRRVEAEGQIAVLPGVPTVALLRAGDGAEVLLDRPATGLKILAVD